MFWGRKFIRERLTEPALRFGRHSNLRSFDLKRQLFSNKNNIAIIFIPVLAFIITLLCFWGQDLIWVQFIPNSKTKMQVVAEIPFEYFSKIKTQRLREQRRNLVAPIYRIDPKVYENFEKEIFKLDELLDAFSDQKCLIDAYLFELRSFIRNFNEKNGMNISWSDVDTVIRGTDEYGRTGILIEGLAAISDILSEGICDRDLMDQKSKEYFLDIEVEGALRRAYNRSEDEAVRFLKLRLSSVDAAADLLQAVFRILKTGIKPNIVFDNSATAKKITKTIQETPDVIEKVFSGDILIEAGSMVGPEDYERLLAYRAALQDENVSLIGTNNNLSERFFISFLVLLLVYLFFCTTRKDLRALTRKEFLLVIILLLLNLLICRFIIWFFELRTFEEIIAFTQVQNEIERTTSFWSPLYLMPYLMPLTFSCLLGTLLLRTYIGMLLGIVTSIFCCLMLSQTIEFLVVAFAIVFVSVYFSRHAHMRAQVIRSGSFSGIVFASAAIVFSFGGHITQELCLLQTFLGFCNGLLTSMIILIILPFFENIFKCCTNICLIELTDYRSPLLTKLQILAPGTYHHSLMVANLAEQAAVSIQANPILCRTLALYHDVGKLIKPEYFTENQSKNKNPHDEKTPFMSALIIKSHVKEGIAIAKAAGLPPRVIGGIAEHHGTTVVRYFYSKALKQQEEVQSSSDPSVLNQPEIEKSAFKYDGPRPRSKETLILSIADSIEAASRSLYNPTPQSIESLINGVIDGKIKENQFDDCLITFREVDELRHSFYFTLLNMLHSRVSYDEVKV